MKAAITGRHSPALISLFLVLFSELSSSQNPVESSIRCDDAKVIALKGGWIANPGSRPLANWSCVNFGDEIALAKDSEKGHITIIYHRGAKAPKTIKCGSRAECRNAYRVEAAPPLPNVPKSPHGKVLDFFFSIFHDESRPVTGITQGTLMPAPAVACTYGQNVMLRDVLKPGFYNLNARALNEEAQDVTWEPAQNRDTQSQNRSTVGAAIGSSAGSDKQAKPGGKGSNSLVINRPLEGPALFEVETRERAADGSTVFLWVLMAPQPLCSKLSRSYQEAVNFTKTWDKDTPAEAGLNFKLRYLQGLASQTAEPSP